MIVQAEGERRARSSFTAVSRCIDCVAQALITFADRAFQPVGPKQVRIEMLEGTNYTLSRWFTCTLDHHTDSIIPLNAVDSSDGSVIDRAMEVPRGAIEANYSEAGYTIPSDDLFAHYVDGTDFDGTEIYPRYWHGCLVLVKPLLEVLDYASIRVVNGIMMYRSFSFFAIIALVLLLSSAGLFLPVFHEWLMTGQVPRFPTLIVSGFLAMGAMLSFFCGLIPDTIRQKNLQDFEYRLLDARRQQKTCRKSCLED